MTTQVPDAWARLIARAEQARVVVGIWGGPGSGKSTLAARIADECAWLGPVVIPMDGFHLSNAELERRGLSDCKGAPETFDIEGLLGLLLRVRAGERVQAPAYDRARHEPVVNAIDVPADARLIIVEGNYLGLRAGLWPQIADVVDELWYLDVPWSVSRSRLIERHIAGGRSREDAAAWVDRVDAANFEWVVANARR